MSAMFVETMLPLGRADSGLKVVDGAVDICTTASDALRVETLGFDGLAVQENKDDPYVICTLALHATSRLRARYAGLASAQAFSIPLRDAADHATLSRMVRALQAE